MSALIQKYKKKYVWQYLVLCYTNLRPPNKSSLLCLRVARYTWGWLFFYINIIKIMMIINESVIVSIFYDSDCYNSNKTYFINHNRIVIIFIRWRIQFKILCIFRWMRILCIFKNLINRFYGKNLFNSFWFRKPFIQTFLWDIYNMPRRFVLIRVSSKILLGIFKAFYFELLQFLIFFC